MLCLLNRLSQNLIWRLGGGKQALQKVTALESRVGALEGGKPKASIVETWHSGSSWYRKYSDGWIEQGGDVGDNRTINLHKPYKNTSYTVVGTGKRSSTVGSYENFDIQTKRTTSFVWIGQNPTGALWFACGY